MYSGLRKVGEAVKEKNENLLTGERVRARTRARVFREGVCVRVIGEGDGKVGRNEKEIGGGSEEGGGMN